jgi:hypothetical protein
MGAVLLLSLKSKVGAAVFMENRSKFGAKFEENGAKQVHKMKK